MMAERKAQQQKPQPPKDEDFPGEPLEAEHKTPPLFDSLNASPLDPVIESIVSDDVFRHYKRLEQELTIGENRGDYATVLQAVDRAEDNARLAHKLYLAGKIERERANIVAQMTLKDLRTQALAELHNEKTEGTRRKQITDSDVDYKCAAMHPHIWEETSLKIRRIKAAEEDLESLAELWKSRCRTLQTILHTLRK